MAIIRIEVCDVCLHPERPVTKYQVSTEGRPPAITVRCAEHSAPLEEVLQKQAEDSEIVSQVTPAKVAKPRKVTGRNLRITTMEEVAQARRPQKKE